MLNARALGYIKNGIVPSLSKFPEFYEFFYRLVEKDNSDLYEMRDAAWKMRERFSGKERNYNPYDFIDAAIRFKERLMKSEIDKDG